MSTEAAPLRLFKSFFDNKTREGRKHIVIGVIIYVSVWIVTAVLLGVFVDAAIVPFILVMGLLIGHMTLFALITMGVLIHEAVTDWLDG